MKASELREMTNEELESSYDDMMKDYFNLRLQQSLGQLEKPSRLRLVRRDIARLLTTKTARNSAVEEQNIKQPEEQEA